MFRLKHRSKKELGKFRGGGSQKVRSSDQKGPLPHTAAIDDAGRPQRFTIIAGTNTTRRRGRARSKEGEETCGVARWIGSEMTRQTHQKVVQKKLRGLDQGRGGEGNGRGQVKKIFSATVEQVYEGERVLGCVG